MAKKMKKILGIAMAAVLCTASVVPALADGEPVVTEENGLTITTTTEVTEEGQNTVTVTIEEWTNVAEGEELPEVIIKGEETTTVTDNAKKTETVVDGSETQSWVEEDDGSEPGQIEVEVELVPGETTTAEGVTVTETDNIAGGSTENNSDITTTTTVEREVTATTGEEKVTVNEFETTLEGIEPDADKTCDATTETTAGKDYSNQTVTNAPEDYDFQLVGSGEASYHGVNKIQVVYAKDEDGNPIKDENGEYVIEKLLSAKNGAEPQVLTQNGVPTTDLDGPFDQYSFSSVQQFVLMNEDGDTVYAYCVDIATGANKGAFYQVSNLEDNDYYATEDAADHVRSIVTNGYWGTKEGTGSISKIREDMKAALAAGIIEKEYDITFMVKGDKYTEGYELQEGEYVNGGYICKMVTEHVVLTDELIDLFNEGEAMASTQAAIWAYANGSNATLDGTDRRIVGDVAASGSALGTRTNPENDFIGAARTLAFYNYLINLETEEESTIIINDKNNVEDMSLVVKDKVAGHENNADDDDDNDVYHTELKFNLAFVPDPESDDLLVYLTGANGEAIKDADGNPIVKRLAGKDSEGREAETILPDEDGVYTIAGLQLQEGDFTFDLRLEGTQYLEQGVYVYTAQGGINASQTLVGMAEGTNTVDITKSMTISFDVDENDKVVAERKWHSVSTTNKTTGTTRTPARTTINEEGVPLAASADGLVEILDEEVPLADAPETGDNSIVYVLMSIISLCGIALLMMKKNAVKGN